MPSQKIFEGFRTERVEDLGDLTETALYGQGGGASAEAPRLVLGVCSDKILTDAGMPPDRFAIEKPSIGVPVSQST